MSPCQLSRESQRRVTLGSSILKDPNVKSRVSVNEIVESLFPEGITNGVPSGEFKEDNKPRQIVHANFDKEGVLTSRVSEHATDVTEVEDKKSGGKVGSANILLFKGYAGLRDTLYRTKILQELIKKGTNLTGFDDWPELREEYLERRGVKEDEANKQGMDMTDEDKDKMKDISARALKYIA